MKIENIVMHVTMSFIMSGAINAKAGDTNSALIWPSTLNPKAGSDVVYLDGTNLVPSEQVFVYIPKDNNGWTFYADTNGSCHAEIMYPPLCVTEKKSYSQAFSVWTLDGDASTNFSVTYSPERIEAPRSVITHMDMQPVGLTYFISLHADESVGNFYQVECTTNLAAGPWVPLEGITHMIWTSSCTNDSVYGFYANYGMSHLSQSFYRIVCEQ